MKKALRKLFGMVTSRELKTARYQFLNQLEKIRAAVSEEGEHKANGAPKPQGNR